LNEAPAIPYERLFTERIDGSLHANIEYRRGLFSHLRELCIQNELSFALCMEFEKTDTETMVKTASGKLRKVTSRGMNAEFMTGCSNCEGIDIPVYVRDHSGESGHYVDCRGNSRPRFAPAASCGAASRSSRWAEAQTHARTSTSATTAAGQSDWPRTSRRRFSAEGWCEVGFPRPSHKSARRGFAVHLHNNDTGNATHCQDQGRGFHLRRDCRNRPVGAMSQTRPPT